MAHTFDAVLKDLAVWQPRDYSPLLRMPADEVVQPLNVDLSTLSAATDVAFGYGKPLREIVDVNFQSGPDPELPRRLLLYNAALHFRYRVPVRSVAILLRPKADAAALTGVLSYQSGGKRVEYEYDVVRLWQQPLAPFLHGGAGLLPLATLCQMPEGKALHEALREVVHAIDQRLAAELEHAEAVRLMTAAFILTGLRVERASLAEIYKGATIMHDSSAFELMEDRGAMRLARRLLLKQGQKRFGTPETGVEGALAAIEDLERLERMFDALAAAASWQELLATP